METPEVLLSATAETAPSPFRALSSLPQQPHAPPPPYQSLSRRYGNRAPRLHPALRRRFAFFSRPRGHVSIADQPAPPDDVSQWAAPRGVTWRGRSYGEAFL